MILKIFPHSNLEILMKPLISVLTQKIPARRPIWMMRQAGRYLPEYRALRTEAGGFLEMVYNPKLAIEITMQPIRRFEMDGAILFSDILVIPHALGQDVWFESGKGPSLKPITLDNWKEILSYDQFDSILNPVYQTVSGVREALDKEEFHQTAHIGFAGAPWTVICYMMEGGGSKDFLYVRQAAMQNPEKFQQLVDFVTDATILYLKNQIKAGVEAVKLFDSWSGLLDEQEFQRWVIKPAAKICAAIKSEFPKMPIIGLPKGAGFLYQDYIQNSGITAIACDHNVPVDMMKSWQEIMPVQGNLDPAALLAGGDALKARLKTLLETLDPHRHILNLGHGVDRLTNPEHVNYVINTLRKIK
jgi:uroporphyrinogen decarboxylase